MGSTLRVLMIEESADRAARIAEALSQAGFDPTLRRVAAEPELRSALREDGWDLVISDYSTSSLSGMEALQLLRNRGSEAPFVLVSDGIGEARVAEALRAGCHDYVPREDLGQLGSTVRRVLAESEGARDRRQAEEALQAGERRYRRLFEMTAIAQLELDLSHVAPPASGESGTDDSPEALHAFLEQVRIGAVNPAAVRLFDSTGQQELLAAGSGLLAPIAPAIRDALLRGGEVRAEAALPTLRGRAVEVVATVSVPADDLSQVPLSLVDLTERNRLERQLHAAQRMEAVARLAAGVAHDFNNLLSVIGSHADFLLDDLEPASRTHADAQVIRDSAFRAATLVNQLLAYTRGQPQELRPMVLNTVVSDLERLLRRVIGEDIRVRTSLEPVPWPVCADGGQLEQVLINLVVNARDAMPQGGTLTIETANVECSDPELGDTAPAPGRYAVLRVTDEGAGMDEDTCLRCFEPFFTTKEQGLGTGLGLSTTHGIVEQSGGFITVESEVGRGTTFSVHLPAAEGRPSEVRLKAQPEPGLNGTETVLVVEDETTVRAVIRRILQSRGYRVLEAEDGAAALVEFGKHEGEIDVLITDLVMPTMGGEGLVRSLRIRRPDLRVLYVSGYGEAVAGLEAGEGAALLGKPFTVEDLLRRLREVLD